MFHFTLTTDNTPARLADVPTLTHVADVAGRSRGILSSSLFKLDLDTECHHHHRANMIMEGESRTLKSDRGCVTAWLLGLVALLPMSSTRSLLRLLNPEDHQPDFETN